MVVTLDVGLRDHPGARADGAAGWAFTQSRIARAGFTAERCPWHGTFILNAVRSTHGA
jgi:hypothetical protein